VTQQALVVGAGGAVGEAIVMALAERGWRVQASMRTRRDDAVHRLAAAGASSSFHDIATDDGWIPLAEQSDALIFATHLELTVAALARAPPIERVVAFSSNNVAIHPEAETYRALAAAETALRARFPAAAIIRPTLIYGDPRLETLTRLLRMAHTWPVMPLPGSGRARIQPVFHEDLANVAAGLADRAASGVYAVGGPDVITMRDLYQNVKRVTAGRAPILPTPSAVLGLASALGFYSAEQTARANRDRTVIPQTPLPQELLPRTRFDAGLARHWAAINA
jgi:uncharacterized protein YbjT (DUF2867 family)